MREYQPLRIAEVRRETPEAISVTLHIPEELREAFRFKPGQHLPLRASIDGEEQRRTYSICCAPGEAGVRIAIKRIADGRFSNWANDTLAAANREAFDRAGTYTINMMSSPGAGKTALLERTLERLRGSLHLGVLEGDVQTTLDADRLARFRIPLVQVNTDPGFGGECHLDANMVRSGLVELDLDDIDILVIENVGNLVCPAEFRVGEDVRVMVYSVTEGEEKPLKYPLMFRSADLVLVNKVDLLEYLDFDLEQFLDNLDAVNPGVRRMLTSARTGQGVDELSLIHI